MASLMQSLSETIEANYSIEHTAGWTYKYLFVPPLASVLYLLVIFSGKKWMQDRQPFDLKRPLAVWNSMLAAFSVVGFVVLAPPILDHIREHGYFHAVCNSRINDVALLSLWAYLFVLSKLVEFGDTLFIVLRKTPLNFLHWYHHITVLLYSWYGLATRNTAGHWFSSLNFAVHAFMYSYYMLKSMGFRIPSSVAKAITIMQLAQFVVGLTVVLTGVWMRWAGHACGMSDIHIRTGFVMYGSYFILFLNFFYKRYGPKQQKKEQ